MGADEVFVGRLVKPFGIQGEMKFVGSDDFWPQVLDSKRIEMRWNDAGRSVGEPAAIVRYRPHGDHWVLRLEGVDDRNAAEARAGAEFFVDPDALDVPPPEDERPFQVIGKRVRLEGGRDLGTVDDVLYSAAHPVYRVNGPDGELLIPAVDEFVVAHDAAMITIRPIPGLIDEDE